jgi:two-component system CheB/CheR fusion protein
MFAELVTARKRQEEALRMAERLASAGRLAATVAHEINNPLEAVTNLLYLAQSDPERAGDYLSRADQELKRVAQITRQTLGFYRDTGGPGWTDISEIADEVLQLYQFKLDEKAIYLRKKLSPGCTVWAKAGEIGQVMSNLLVNAIDASRHGGQVTLKIAPTTDWKDVSKQGVRITLSDCGCGIAPENKIRVFDPFWTTKKNTGTGLGLWVTQSLMTNLGGRITMRSSVKPGRSGTVFSIFVPYGKPDPTTEPVSTEPANQAKRQSVNTALSAGSF